MNKPVVYLASDHRGFSLKSQLVAWLEAHKFIHHDLGTHSEERCDSIDYALKLAHELESNPRALGVLICGTGNGMAMVANRYAALRAALCTNSTMARLARQHNDANVLVLGAHITGKEVAEESLAVFLETDFLGGRYGERRERFDKLGGLKAF